jgi:hypothetical protein
MSLTFLGEVIKPVTSASDLGVTLDTHLAFDSHITKVVSSCISKLCQINRVKSSFDHKARRTRAHLSRVLVIRDKLDRQNFLVCGQHLRHFRRS